MFFYHLTKIKWNFKMNETWFKIVVKHEFFNNLSKIIGVHLHKIHNYESIVYS